METSVKSALDKLSNKDIYSLLMFVLFKVNEVPELAVLSQLIYLLDEDSFIKLLKYFGGQKIVIPTINDLRVLIHSLVMYKSIELDGLDFNSSFNNIPDELKEDVLYKYESIKNIMSEYSFV